MARRIPFQMYVFTAGREDYVGATIPFFPVGGNVGHFQPVFHFFHVVEFRMKAARAAVELVLPFVLRQTVLRTVQGKGQCRSGIQGGGS